jgi:membrane dipeptidase
VSSLRRVFDLHADLLHYLAARPGRSPLQSTSRCALHQLRDGGVDLQVLPIFTLGGVGAPESAIAQARCFAELGMKWVPHYRPLALGDDAALESPTAPGEGTVAIVAAIENAEGLCAPGEELAVGVARLDAMRALTGPLLYVSLTWRMANRFGGGDAAPGVGLTADGRRLLEALATRVPAVDLSHASDALAEEILAFVDAEGLPLVPLASHSNFRAVTEHARNLPDALAAEIVRRGGIIGLNVVRAYVGGAIERLAEHVAHGVARGWGRHLALGTDFFWEGDLPSAGRWGKHHFFFPGFEDASCHPALQEVIAAATGGEALEGLTSRNLGGFLRRVWVERGKAG